MPPAPSLLGLAELPKSPKKDAHIWADYIELRCLTDPDHIVSKADLEDLIHEQNDLRKGIDEDDEDDVDDAGEVPSDIRTNLWIDELFKHLIYRAEAFNEFYPFTISKAGNILQRRSRITFKHKLYLFFLLSSNTEYIRSRQLRGKFTSGFEVASMMALKSYLPANAEIYLFGSTPLNKGRYSGNLWRKINLLAQDLRERVIGDESEYSPHDTGDNGLDVIGWIPINDIARGFLLVFGQCACTADDWAKKQSSSSAPHWRDTIQFKVPPCNMVFIPFCFRRVTGEWHKHRMIDESILIDRLRLVLLLRQNYRLIVELPYDLIDLALNQRDSLV